jgi:HPt (histidine-containing phosphotransfer) domain-containing protein
MSLPPDSAQDASRPGVEPAMNLTSSLARLGSESDAGKARALLTDLARMFLEDYPELLTKLRAAIDGGQPREAERFAHSIKGLSATFDGHPTHRAAYNIEKCSAAGDLAGAQLAIADLEAEIERLSRALRSLVE